MRNLAPTIQHKHQWQSIAMPVAKTLCTSDYRTNSIRFNEYNFNT
jgi:hypothetical protein